MLHKFGIADKSFFTMPASDNKLIFVAFRLIHAILLCSIALFLYCTTLLAPVSAQEIKPLTPSKKDKCPVCGMFVYKYPDWTAQIIFKDGTVVFFDGVKDMVKYYLNMNKYAPLRKVSDILALFVNDYYSLKPIDAKKAFYVIGSDVYGPMGKELIPFAKEAEAKEFMKDHKGVKILTFQGITAETLKSLEE
ncbi:MAG: nitrous oxide reductase accessory protein NosL [Thermodesulfovibrionales bacterium]